MPALEEIQKRVDEALADYNNHNFDHVRTVIWPDIREKIGAYTGLDLSGRRALGWLVYKRLNDWPLQAMPSSIHVTQLIADLDAGRVTASPPNTIPKPWLVY